MLERLIVFTKYPVAGKVKTRMIPTLGIDLATSVHTALARQTLSTAREFSERRGNQLQVYFADGPDFQMRQLFGQRYDFHEQVGGDLGQRLKSALHDAINDGVGRVIFVGTDCPTLTNGLLSLVFDRLADSQSCLIPALDGGYVLIGLQLQNTNRDVSKVFDSIDWGGPTVHAQTLKIIRELGLKHAELPMLADVDFAQDLLPCRSILAAFDSGLPEIKANRITVIIPVRNEASVIAKTLEQFASFDDEVQVMVVDGGSIDETVSIAQTYGVRVIHATGNRGMQLNCGAVLASGEYLVFLHADTILPEDFADQVRNLLNTGTTIGAFRLRIADATWSMQVIAYFANLRSRWFGLPYGDQALFIKAAMFARLGGFKLWPLLEDFEFSRRAARHGKMSIATSEVTTSNRRWKRFGTVKTTLINQAIVLAYICGISLERLATIYRKRR